MTSNLIKLRMKINHHIVVLPEAIFLGSPSQWWKLSSPEGISGPQGLKPASGRLLRSFQLEGAEWPLSCWKWLGCREVMKGPPVEGCLRSRMPEGEWTLGECQGDYSRGQMEHCLPLYLPRTCTSKNRTLDMMSSKVEFPYTNLWLETEIIYLEKQAFFWSVIFW